MKWFANPVLDAELRRFQKELIKSNAASVGLFAYNNWDLSGILWDSNQN